VVQGCHRRAARERPQVSRRLPCAYVFGGHRVEIIYALGSIDPAAYDPAAGEKLIIETAGTDLNRIPTRGPSEAGSSPFLIARSFPRRGNCLSWG